MFIGVNLSIIGQLLGTATPIFSPATLFALSEPGVWYDPSDLTTLFQDSAGTTPVTAPGQPVGLALDKSKGLVLGSEQSPALPDYQTVLTGTWAASGANYVFTDTVGGQARPGIQWPTTSLAAGSYQIVVVVAAINGATQIRLDGVGATDQLLTVGSNTRIVSVTSTSRPRFRLEDLSTTIGDSFTITSISVRELPGFHAVQNVNTSFRPTYGVVPSRGRVNLFNNSENLTSHSVVRATASNDQAVAPDGTTTADSLTETATTGDHRVDFTSVSVTSGTAYTFWTIAKANTRGWIRLLFSSGAFGTTYANFDLSTGAVGTTAGVSATSVVDVGSGFYLVSATATAIATGSATNAIQLATGNNTVSYTGDGTSGVFLWRWQFELGSTASPYQRVGSQFDVTDPVGFPTYPCHYLQFDGVDDFLVTPTITPGADKVQVFAGVRKLSDAAQNIVAELSVATSLNNGTFALSAPGVLLGDYAFYSRGSLAPSAAARSLVAPPSTNILTGLGDISGDIATLRLNGSQVAQSTADQGTGNYLAYPLYIGRRGGTTLPFNGQIFGLIVRFSTANLDAGLISQTERWMAGKTPIDAASEVTWNDSTDTYTQRLYNGFGV